LIEDQDILQGSILLPKGLYCDEWGQETVPESEGSKFEKETSRICRGLYSAIFHKKINHPEIMQGHNSRRAKISITRKSLRIGNEDSDHEGFRYKKELQEAAEWDLLS